MRPESSIIIEHDMLEVLDSWTLDQDDQPSVQQVCFRNLPLVTMAFQYISIMSMFSKGPANESEPSKHWEGLVTWIAGQRSVRQSRLRGPISEPLKFCVSASRIIRM